MAHPIARAPENVLMCVKFKVKKQDRKKIQDLCGTFENARRGLALLSALQSYKHPIRGCSGSLEHYWGN